MSQKSGYTRGCNRLEDEETSSLLTRFLAQLYDPLIFLLFGAAAVSVLLGETGDACIILTVVFLNASFGVAQEGRAQKALRALKELSSPHALLKVGADVEEIPAAELIVGDIVVLEAGRIVPADLYLTETVGLQIEESALTGESVPVDKDTGRHREAYMSTYVTNGRGEGVVCAIGMDTKIGKIAQLLRHADTEPTPLQRRLAELGKILGALSVLLCAVLFALAIYQRRNVGEMLLTAISLAVAAVPEGLPAIVTMVLAFGVSKMARVGTIVRHLPSVETLGCVDVVCTDKTGTLTENKMTVVACYPEDACVPASELAAMDQSRFRSLLEAAVLCNDAMLTDQQALGDPTELALLALGERLGIKKHALEKRMPRVDEIPFDSARKRMTTMHQKDGTRTVYLKGAPDEVLACCKTRKIQGRAVPLSLQEREKIGRALHEMAGRGLRVLALAMREQVNNVTEEQMEFLGFLGMEDPLRPEAASAVQDFARAGVRTVMITGDGMDTAYAIARAAGIAARWEQCISGETLEHMTDDALRAQLPELSVFAHVSPEHKMRIVRAFQQTGSIVAMTGDGVNDAPSLRAADVGIAMGQGGCDVARNAADIVLTSDNFATIAKAISLGRALYENIRKSVLFLLSSNLGEILTMLVAVAAGLPAPLTASHILWINLITDSLPALALGVDEEENQNYMNRKPRGREESLLAEGGGACTLFYGILIAGVSALAFLHVPLKEVLRAGDAVTLAALKEALLASEILCRARTYAFTVLGMAQLFHAVGMRDVETSVFAMNWRENKVMLLALTVGIGLQVLATENRWFAALFGGSRLAVTEWIGLLLCAMVPLVAHELLVGLSNR